jgi:hypothetical protein
MQKRPASIRDGFHILSQFAFYLKSHKIVKLDYYESPGLRGANQKKKSTGRLDECKTV